MKRHVRLMSMAVCLWAALAQAEPGATTKPARTVLGQKPWADGWTLTVVREADQPYPKLMSGTEAERRSPATALVPVSIRIEKGDVAIPLWSSAFDYNVKRPGDTEVLDMAVYDGHAVVVLATPFGDILAIKLTVGWRATVTDLTGWSVLAAHMPHKHGRVKAAIRFDAKTEQHSIYLTDNVGETNYVTLYSESEPFRWKFGWKVFDPGGTTVNPETGVIERRKPTTIPTDQ